ncbi:MAG: M4 family metallopeptidase [Sandaracinaceae bacterium]|nr:M4 family metallopeptidase [Sandaracinaceae bacterium]
MDIIAANDCEIVRRLTVDVVVEPRQSTVFQAQWALTWDGRNEAGSLVAAGDYLYLIDATLYARQGRRSREIDSLVTSAHALVLLPACDADDDLLLSMTCGGTDCDDSSAFIGPGAPELVDGIDNNCNGEVDEQTGWVTETTTVGLDGYTHIVEQQYINGIQVLGSRRASHYFEGRLRSHTRNTSTNVDIIDMQPTIGSDEAISSVKDFIIAEEIARSGYEDPSWRERLDEFEYYAGAYSLRVYDSDVFTEDSTSLTRLVYRVGSSGHIFLVDAHSSDVVLSYSTQLHADVEVSDGSHLVDGACQTSWRALPGPVVYSTSGPTSTDPDAVSAYQGTDAFDRIVGALFGRDGWNGQAATYISTVHSTHVAGNDAISALHCLANGVEDPECLCDHTGHNAAWLTEEDAAFLDIEPQIIFTEGMAVTDIVAHEWGHAVVQSTSGLLGGISNEQNALGEALGDLFGIVVDYDDYTLGEDSVIGVRRNFADPTTEGHPDNYLDAPAGLNGHALSGVVNKAHFLMIEGTSGFLGVAVDPIGRTKLLRVVYNTLDNGFLMPGSTIRDYALATLASCEQLRQTDSFGLSSEDCVSIFDAWLAVRVLGGFRVNCGMGDDFPTVQDAILAAPDEGRVEICAGLYLEHLVIDSKHLTIVAASGEGTATIDGSGAGSVVSIFDSNVTLEGLVITNGSAAFPDGAGIDAVIGSLVVDGCTIANNRGRGIHAANSVTSIFDSTIQQNQGDSWGGGIAVNGVLEIYDSQVLNNVASSGGGGIYASFASLYMENTTVAGNSVLAATESIAGGGGVLLRDSRMFSVNSSITSNSTLGASGGCWRGYERSRNAIRILCPCRGV